MTRSICTHSRDFRYLDKEASMMIGVKQGVIPISLRRWWRDQRAA